jgi:hypothetical protein
VKRMLSICLVALGVIAMARGADRAGATPITFEPCPSVSLVWRIAALDPLINSETWGLFKDWDLQQISAHVCETDKAYRITADYILPTAYSSKKLTYHFRLTFAVDEHAVLINPLAYRLSLIRLDDQIASFERDPAIEQFLVILNDRPIQGELDHTFDPGSEQIDLEFDWQNSASYDLKRRRVLVLRFADPVLIANKEKLVPALANLPEEPPPGHNIGIHYDALDDTVSQFDASHPVLGNTMPLVGQPPTNQAAARERGGSLLFWVPVLLLGLFVIAVFTKGEAGRPQG